MTYVEVHHGAATDLGLVRTANEDSYLTAAPVFVVADGMGGHDAGDVASRIAVEEFAELAEVLRGEPVLEPDSVGDRLAATFISARERIEAYGEERRDLEHLDFSTGTTAAVAVLVNRGAGSMWMLANVGDSRIYGFSDGRLTQISVDHSVVQELIDAGSITAAQAAVHPGRHVITRALGVAVSSQPDYFEIPLVEAERVLLCSDGVSGLIDDAQIAEILDASEDPRDAAERLVAAAVAAGGFDNATAVVIDVVGLVHDMPYDSDAQRQSLEEKLGALP